MSVDTATALVTTDWLAERLSDPGVVVAEVDEDPDLYEEGHIEGAVKLHWRDDLQDELVRDVVSKEAVRAVDGRPRDRERHVRRALRRQEQLVRGVRLLVPQALRARGRAVARRRPPEVDRGGPRPDDRASFAAAVSYAAGDRDESIRVRARRGARRPRVGEDRARRRAQPTGVLGRADGAARIRAGGRVADGAHPRARSRSPGRPPFGTTARSRAPTS